MRTAPIRLGVNINHVATLRNARGGTLPDPLEMALLLAEAGDTDLITVHLREDRRHIRDGDVVALRREVPLPLNLEMAMTREMLKIAQMIKPDWVCLVPENRREITTEGGLDMESLRRKLPPFIEALNDYGINVSLFIDPDIESVDMAASVGAQAVELHTGAYSQRHSRENGNLKDPSLRRDDVDELLRLQSAAAFCAQIGLHCHAGHGLTYANVAAVAAIPHIEELNIGHFLVGEALKTGLVAAVREMKQLMNSTRNI